MSIKRAASNIFDFIIFASGMALAFLMMAQVIMRYVLSSGFLGIEEIAVLFGVWFYFLGVAKATVDGGHIQGGIPDLIVRSEIGKKRLKVIKHLVLFLANLAFLLLSFNYFMGLVDSGRTSSYMEWPTYWWVLSMVVGFLVSTVCVANNAILKRREEEQGELT